ncbi:hypothetical protein [Thiolapillus brandeum]|uniref:hypothetical protein n=1 Tax=Thiolapillus brandeum TaxID=1076588 RepID=UPI000596EFA7|nr:hypothetical protein [Thiolapillus brandeum]
MDNLRKKLDTLVGTVIVFTPTVAFFVVALRGDDPIAWLEKIVATGAAYAIMAACLVVVLMIPCSILKLLNR